MRLEFSPPSTTRKVQQPDAGIIAWVKKTHGCRLSFNLFTAVRRVIEKWLSYTNHVIMKCFDHCFKQGVTAVKSGGEDENGTLESMTCDGLEHEMTLTRAGLWNLSNPCDKKTVREKVKFGDLGWEAATISGNDDEPQRTVELEALEEKIEISGAQPQCLVSAIASLESHGGLSDACQKAFLNCHREVRLEKQKKLKQTMITD